MSNPETETRKRIQLAQNLAEQFKDHSRGIILAGSTAYSPNLHVREDSDLDLILVQDSIKDILPTLIKDKNECQALQNRYFEGYCIQTRKEGIPLSLHVLSSDAFTIINTSYVSNMRVYRSQGKKGSYQLRNFLGDCYNYDVKNIPLQDLQGVRTIVPISFLHKDLYHLGIHRDKLLSNPIILMDQDDFIQKGIDKLWSVVSENLRDESYRLQGMIDLTQRNILKALDRNSKFTQDTTQYVMDKTCFHLKLNN